ncbi:peptide/nickel transport system permease protein [Streptosporangium becharense]|uniref:Peptide/nickel transport system permease protein n=1 Tax=Streptosporangium becharense TaxID=1816182 RepID=A0A7W9IC90_9ACTN|nr:peptide/nickel transport system permease protein [Streptosporangium becharense]MBB5817850.1 peptide/nickel transport system permease protein [Streptosporangium becharense]
MITVIVISAVAFGIFFVVPVVTGTDPALMYVGKTADAAAIEGARQKMGMDKPIPVQYAEFLKGIVVGRDYSDGTEVTHCSAPCLGYSFKTEQEVWPLLLDRIPVTAQLAVGAAVLWLLIGVSTGIISALRKGSAVDRTAMTVALAGVSLPINFTGLLASAIFVYALGWFPATGDVGMLEDPVTWFQSMLLPWITLAFLFAALYARLTRASMLEVMGEDYIRTARAKGLKEKTVVTKHALRSTLVPILTVFGLDLGQLMGGAVLTERVFNLRGMGYEAVGAINQGDLPIILGVTMFAAIFVVLANLLVDLLYAVLDPRVKLA